MELMQLLWPAALAVQAVHVAARLGLADLMASGPQSVDALAGATHTHAPSLARLLRALASLGIFEADTDQRYRQTPLSDTLRTDHPQSMRPWAMMLGAGFVWRPSGELAFSVETGSPAFDHVYGTQFFKHLAAHQTDAAIFNAAMSSMPAYIDAVVDAYDFSRAERIVDVGGGHGALLFAILLKHPHLRGVLQDLPAVVQGADPPALVTNRAEIVAGDFFESVPAGADIYLLKGIIHDWDDDAAVKILRNCRRAMQPGKHLLILDSVLTPSSDPGQSLMDLLMMVLTSGRERTELEFRSLLHAAGFALLRVIPTTGHSILESQAI